MAEHVTLKGGRDGLRVVLDPAVEPPVLLEAVRATLASRLPFLTGAEITFDTAGRPLCPELVCSLIQLAAEFDGVRVRGFMTDGLPQSGHGQNVPAAEVSRVHHVRTTLRNGQVASSQGDLLVYGNVNPGAEVVARGDIFVLGKLRGLAHAGHGGRRDSVVYSTIMEPRQLRIGDVAAVGDGKPGSGPEVALVHEGTIRVLPIAEYLEMQRVSGPGSIG